MSDTVYNKENFIQHLEVLKPNGYTFSNEGYYYKDEVNRKIRIFLDADQDFPFDVRFYGAGVQVCFTEVEQIFHQVWQNFSSLKFEHSLNAPTFKKGFRENVIGTSGYQFLLQNRVADTASFNEAFPYLNQLMNASVNFITQYTTLQDFYNYGEGLATGRERASFYNQPLPARKMIIKKLLNISDYSTYSTDVVNHYNQQPDVEEAAFLQALKNYLDTL